MSLSRRTLTVVAVATLTLAGLGVNANAEDAPSAAATVTTGRPVPKQPEPVARGLIVQTTTTTPSDGALAATDDALGSKAEVKDDDKLTGKISTIDFDQTVSSDVAADVAATVAKRADVVWAAPNTLRQHEAASPVCRSMTRTSPSSGTCGTPPRSRRPVATASRHRRSGE
ncbi:hypothetical protein [Aeromicrobium ginsengisoli]|uniref:Uncharacterized protein n=1 Tax=Aeromicrobium ginsengisoli TaxID=363867 RepID=A0A5M4FDM7_9ACTN|nr:hypothetical protein [Aeromicrobium ginsengisoli]KAA1397349.1 hypothetical protein ESP70_008145 [Aeromicrobium ginsengisoli]